MKKGERLENFIRLAISDDISNQIDEAQKQGTLPGNLTSL